MVKETPNNRKIRYGDTIRSSFGSSPLRLRRSINEFRCEEHKGDTSEAEWFSNDNEENYLSYPSSIPEDDDEY